MTRTQFVKTALSYINTPFQHQARLPGVAMDCAGVVVCALKANDYPVADQQGYGRIPSGGQFMQAVLEHCDSIELSQIKIGDLMVFSFKGEPQHVAIVTQTAPIMLLHSWEVVGKVVENSLDSVWLSRLRGCYRLKNIED